MSSIFTAMSSSDSQPIVGIVANLCFSFMFPITFDQKGDLEGGATYFFQVSGNDFKQVAVMTGN